LSCRWLLLGSTEASQAEKNQICLSGALVKSSARLSASSEKGVFPPGLNNAYLFALFNALPFKWW